MKDTHMVHRKLVIWDWNGTLLNDTAASVEAMNRMLARRGMQALTEEKYRSVFGFPVQDYYTELGFDFSRESFDALSVEFIENYRELQKKSELHDAATELLREFRAQGTEQIILSAMERNTLRGDVAARGIEGFFSHILGVKDHYAAGKKDIGLAFLARAAHPAEDILLIGDTCHDHEVAEALGCGCMLVAQGHHPFERLAATGAPVQKNLRDVLNLLINP